MQKFLGKIKISVFVLAIYMFPTSILAFPYYSAETQQFDTQLVDQTLTQYKQPKEIQIVQVTTPSNELYRQPSQWVKSLYYYSITRLRLPNLPYTYLLDENGIIYQGNSYGVGATSPLETENGVVTIGYLSNNPIITNRAGESLNEMVEEISQSWGISQISYVEMYINQKEDSLSTITTVSVENDFTQSISNTLSSWEGYTEEGNQYKAEIEEIVYEPQVEIGEKINVKVKIKNMNEYIWFTDENPVYISVKGGEESPFAVNKEWESFSKPVSISDKNVFPKESVELEFKLEGKVTLGETQESFELIKYANKPFENSSFDVKFNIVKGDKNLVEVDSVKYGFVNIRDCRWFSCEIIDQADNGTVFILEAEESGWSKVKFDTDLSGWVSSRYLKEI